MRRLSSTLVAVTLIASMLHVGIEAADAGSGGTVSYLALGDSLSVGFQPGPTKDSNGYVDDLWRRMEPEIPGLRLKNVGCAGETSRSLITGKHSPCHYAAGSQLNAAVAYLDAHPGEVAFITIDIGANDLLYRCLDFRTGVFGRACSIDLFPHVQSRVTRIVDALATAAGPSVPIVAMSYYDPFLGFWGLIPGGRHAARADQRVWTLLNEALTTGYEDGGATVTDVSATFKIDDFTNTVVVPGRGRIPVNVAIACRWTWFCSAKFFGDPHANDTGYRKIARTFARDLKDLL